MFVLACKESGCVRMTSSKNPMESLNLPVHVYEHFDLFEFDDNTNYTGKFLKVINNELVNLGSIAELEASGNTALMDCNDCPSLI